VLSLTALAGLLALAGLQNKLEKQRFCTHPGGQDRSFSGFLCRIWFFHPIETSWWIMLVYVLIAIDITTVAWLIENCCPNPLLVSKASGYWFLLSGKLIAASYYLFSVAGGFTGGVVHSAIQLLEYIPKAQFSMPEHQQYVNRDDLESLKQDREKASWYSLLPFLSSLLALAVVCLSRNNVFNLPINLDKTHWTSSLMWSFSFLVGFFSKAVLKWLSKLFGDNDKKQTSDNVNPFPALPPGTDQRSVAIVATATQQVTPPATATKPTVSTQQG
jgi:hypothetical protein